MYVVLGSALYLLELAGSARHMAGTNMEGAMHRGNLMSGTVRVSYRNVDGVHVFTSEDVRGFYVASKDLQEAYECVPEGLKVIYKENRGSIATFEPAMSFEDFRKFLGGVDGNDIPHPAVIEARGVAFRSQVTGHGDD